MLLWGWMNFKARLETWARARVFMEGAETMWKAQGLGRKEQSQTHRLCSSLSSLQSNHASREGGKKEESWSCGDRARGGMFNQGAVADGVRSITAKGGRKKIIPKVISKTFHGSN